MSDERPQVSITTMSAAGVPTVYDFVGDRAKAILESLESVRANEAEKHAAAFTSSREEAARLRELFERPEPWPLADVLDVLVNSVDHLLKSHDCDCHGHEEAATARDAGRKLLAKIRAALSTSPALPLGGGLDPGLVERVLREVWRFGECMPSIAQQETVLRAVNDARRSLTSLPSPTPAERHVCCGCGGLCDSGEPCPMAYNCRCRGTSPATTKGTPTDAK